MKGFLVIAAVAIGAIGWQHFHHRSSAADPNNVATQIGAAWCEDGGYQLKNRLDGSKTEIFNCNMQNGSYKCVTTRTASHVM